MKIYLILPLLLFYSCGVIKNGSKTFDTVGRLNINFSNQNLDVSLKGLIYVTNDSSFFNIFGPLGINVAKMRIIKDSINIVDVQNRKIYNSYHKNLSTSIYNVFNGKFSEGEEHLIWSLCYFIDKETWKNLSCGAIGKGPEFNYYFKGTDKRLIKININAKEINYKLRMKYTNGTNNRIGSFNISKYMNFETISIKLQ